MRSKSILIMALVCIGISSVHAGEPFDLRVGVDIRAVYSDAKDSSLLGGYGHTRFDDDHQGLRLGTAYLAARYRVADTFALYADALGYADGNSSMLDVTQLYLQWRPFPLNAIRFSTKVGMFYPEFSMENRGPAWTPVYTITPSAINSWYGEELRTLGTELTTRWLGGSFGYQGDVAFIAGAYGWNDPAGLALASHGWNLHDRQTGLTGYLVATGARAQHIHEFREIDGRVGFYSGLQWHHGDHLDVRVYRYDNRADPAAFKTVYAWLTRFDTIGVRWEVNEDWTALAQWLQGDTYIGPPQTWGAVWEIQSKYLLLSRQWHDWRFSLRRDWFSTYRYRGAGNSHDYDDSGSAWTVAVLKDMGRQFQIAAEWLRVDSTFPAREYAQLEPQQLESQVQLSLRYKWHY